MVPLTKFEGYGPEIVDFGATPGADGVLWVTGIDSAIPGDELLPVPTLYEHSELRDDLQFIQSLAPARQRVSVRAVAQRGYPVIYGPYHWLPDKTMRVALSEAAESGEARDLRELWVQSDASPWRRPRALGCHQPVRSAQHSDFPRTRNGQVVLRRAGGVGR